MFGYAIAIIAAALGFALMLGNALMPAVGSARELAAKCTRIAFATANRASVLLAEVHVARDPAAFYPDLGYGELLAEGFGQCDFVNVAQRYLNIRCEYRADLATCSSARLVRQYLLSRHRRSRT